LRSSSCESICLKRAISGLTPNIFVKFSISFIHVRNKSIEALTILSLLLSLLLFWPFGSGY
jgi:hypothetical protein